MNDLFTVLYELNQNRYLSQREISDKTNISLGKINNILKLLEEENYLLIEKRKKNIYHLTEAGLQLLERFLREEQQKKISLSNDKKVITNAVILLAGQAQEINIPVGLLPLDNETILDRSIQLLISSGITNIVLVVGFAKEMLIPIEKKYPQIHIVVNQQFKTTGTMASLAKAKSFINDDFLLIEGDLVFEERGLTRLLHSNDTSSVLITSVRENYDEAMVEIQGEQISKISKDIHQFNHIDGEMIGMSKFSFPFFEKMLTIFSKNENPLVNYEYIMMDVARDYRLGYVRVDDFIWGEIDDQSQIKSVTQIIYPRILQKEKRLEIDTVRTFIKDKLDVTDKDIDLLESAGGMTNKNYKVILNGQSFIVRIAGNGTDRFIDRTAEKENSIIAQILGLDVETTYFDAETGTKISQFITGAETLNPVTAAYPKNMELTTNLLRKLHHSGLEFSNEFNVFREIEKYEHLADEMAATYYEGYQVLRPLVLSLEKDLLKMGIEKKPCHIDTVPENFVKDNQGKTFLIDWEYSGMNDPVWDLANHSIECNFTNAQEQQLLETYYQTKELPPLIELKVLAYKICSDFVWSAWTIFKESRGDNFGSYGKDRLERAWKNMTLYQEKREDYHELLS
ncbi:NTP transferase domain-containing protein [Streptococcus constellatus]|uniref:Choline/ethanolamine kinase n=2 Tax=Streptococcus constellatus TaxID=76860 RepID=A0AAD2SVQ7_STRCV|nr:MULTISPECIES: NTP transferase domain-containing protein [Streptococcus]EID19111.1 choline/ethanolamine kinase [Streptococcus constellatus subsp. constellatus SK53]MDK6973120.1 NTP transferase domain-containing protein [Streptococcus constellatus]MDN5013535.1 NTP transferase domain-containing protein [Streptococcus sp. SN3]MDP1485540.1 NTP transferase domain-containing protein [Streptococcus constellatus]OFP95478.1 phosphotransferase [Streptococcus sp. HMSC067A03]